MEEIILYFCIYILTLLYLYCELLYILKSMKKNKKKVQCKFPTKHLMPTERGWAGFVLCSADADPVATSADVLSSQLHM